MGQQEARDAMERADKALKASLNPILDKAKAGTAKRGDIALPPERGTDPRLKRK